MKRMRDKALIWLFVLLLIGGCAASPYPLGEEKAIEKHNIANAAGRPPPAPLQQPIVYPQFAQMAESIQTPPAPAPSPAPGNAEGKKFAELAPTVNMSFEELVGDNGITTEPAEYPAPGTFYVIVDIYHQVVMVYEKDEQGAYTVPVRYMICSTGAKKTPTRRGVFETGDHKERFGYFVNDHVYGQYWTHIVSRTYFHSILYTQRNAKTYTKASYSNLGKRASHGCIRLLVPDARFLYYHIAPGSQVEIRAGSASDTATADIKRQLKIAAQPKIRPALEKGEIPNTDTWSMDTYLKKYAKTVSAK